MRVSRLATAWLLCSATAVLFAQSGAVDVQPKPAAIWNQTRVPLPVPNYPDSGSVSPDGRSLAMVVDGGIAVIDLATSRVRVLSDEGASPIWSPDGREIAYASPTPAGTELRIRPPDGGTFRVVLAHTGSGSLQGWSRDGRFLLANFVDYAKDSSPNELVVAPVGAGRARTLVSRIADGNARAAFSPDCQFVAFDAFVADSGTKVVSVLAMSGGPAIPLGTDAMSGTLIDWLPDGRVLLSRDGSAWALRMNRGHPGGVPVLVGRNVGVVRSLGLAGNRLFVLKTIRANDLYNATLDPASATIVGSVVPVPGSLPDVLRGPPVWSPDGTRLGYAKSGGRWAVRNVLDNTEREFAVHLESMTYPSWQPDGRAIVLRARDTSGQSGLFRIDIESEKVEYLGPGSRMLFSRGTQDVVVTRDTQTLRDLRTGADRPLDLPAGARPSARSQDGRLLAAFDGPHQAVVVLPIDGGPPRTLVSQVKQLQTTNFEFSPDGKFVYFAAGVPESTIWRVSVDGGSPQSTGVTLRYVHDMSLSPDGRQLVMRSNWRPTEVWVWESK